MVTVVTSSEHSLVSIPSVSLSLRVSDRLRQGVAEFSADPGFPRQGAAYQPQKNRGQPNIQPLFLENCMKMKKKPSPVPPP